MRKNLLTLIRAGFSGVGAFLLVVWTSAPVAVAQVAADLETATAEYRKYLGRLPFLMHTRGRQKFAKTGHPEALAMLIASYNRRWLETPVDQMNYTLVSICTDAFRRREYLEQLAGWRARFRRPQDSWLWFRTLEAHNAVAGDAALTEIALSTKAKVPIRMAALQAIGAGPGIPTLKTVAKVLGSLPRDSFERTITLHSAAAVLLAQKNMLGTDEYRDALAQLIHLLDDKSLSLRTKVVLARHVRAALDKDQLFIESRPWLAHLAGETGPKDKYAHLYAPPRFFGVEGSGTRIAYVIDMSDSMCKPLSPEFLKKKPKGPITGPKKSGAEKDELPWHNIRTRFDLAREQLKLSLRGLTPDKFFCVCWFGDAAGLLKSTNGLVKASKGNIKKAIRELDAIVAGAPTRFRPDGTLRGLTNLHGGMLCAFRAQKRGMVKAYEHVAKEPFKTGCDTIFVLSDGDPTADNWPQDDKNYGEDQEGDPESRTRMAKMPIMHYPGPYRDFRMLIDDVRRMNLFRKVEIHCIGIGEVHAGYLQLLANVGMGSAHVLGR